MSMRAKPGRGVYVRRDGKTVRVDVGGTVTPPPPTDTNALPVAAFTLTTPAPLTIRVDAAASSDRDGVLVGYRWDFGDGTASSEVAVTHTYATAAVYAVTLAVTDNAGTTTTTTQQVTVTSAGGGDTADPTPPAAPAQSGAGVDYADVSWGASTDNVAIRFYRVSVAPEGGTAAVYGDTPGLTMRIANLAAGKRYTVTVEAHDTAGNISEPATVPVATLTTAGLGADGDLAFDFNAANTTTSPVASVASAGGLPITVTAPDAAKQPLWSVINGNPTWTFDGGDALQANVSGTTLGRNVTGVEIVALVDVPASEAGEHHLAFLSFANTTGRLTLSLLDGKPRLSGRRLAAEVNQTVVGKTDIRGAGPKVISAALDYAGAVARLSVDDLLDTEVAFQTAGNSEDVASGTLTIGAQSGFNTPWVGPLYRVAGFHGVRTQAQRAATAAKMKSSHNTPPPPPPPPNPGGTSGSAVGLKAVEHESWPWKVRLNWTETDPAAEYGILMDDRPGTEVVVKGNTYATSHLEGGSHTFKVRKRLSTTPVVVTNPDGTTTTTYTYTYGPESTIPFTVRPWPAPGTDGKLMWPLPKDWATTPKVINVGANATDVRITTPGDYVINFPVTPIQIPAGNRVFEIYAALPAGVAGKIRYHVPRGHIRATFQDSSITCKLTGHGNGEVWGDIQGLLLDGGAYGDNFQVDFRAPESTLILQDCDAGRVYGYQAGQHADVLQTFAGPKNLMVDRLRGRSDYQYMMLDPKKFDSALTREPGLFGSWSFTNIEAIMYGQSMPATTIPGQCGIPFFSVHHRATHLPRIVYPTTTRGIFLRKAPTAEGGASSLPVSISVGAPLDIGGDQKPGIWASVQRDATPPGGTVLSGTPGVGYTSPGRADVPGASTQAPTTSALRVVGRNLMLGTTEWKAKGSTLYVYPYSDAYTDAEGDRQVAAAVKIADRMKAIGLNSVRIPFSIRASVQTRHGGLDGYATMLANLAKVFTSRNMIVSFCNWDCLFDKAAWVTNVAAGTYWPTHTALMAKVGATNPMVIWEPFNEPNGMDNAAWYTAMRTTLAYYRTTLGYKGVLQIDTPGYSWSLPMPELRNLMTYDATLTGTGASNMVSAYHRYGDDNATFAVSQVASLTAAVQEIPVLSTEHGWENGVRLNAPAWVDGFLDYMATLAADPNSGYCGNIGMFAWHWADKNRITNTDYTTLTAQGTSYRDHYLTKPGT